MKATSSAAGHFSPNMNQDFEKMSLAPQAEKKDPPSNMFNSFREGQVNSNREPIPRK